LYVFVISLACMMLAQGRDVRCVATSTAGGCISLDYPAGQVPTDQNQGLFAASSGLLGQFPYCAVGVAKRTKSTSSQIEGDTVVNGIDNYNLFGAGLIWVYRGLGVICDRDSTPGFQDPGQDQACSDAKTATTDCILAAVVPEQANWNPVQSSLIGRVGKVTVSDKTGLFLQECYLKGNGTADEVQSGVTLGNSNTKCDITVNNVRNTLAWPATSDILINAAGIQGCGVASDHQHLAIQVYVASAGASTTPVTSGTSQALALGLATTLKWNTKATCTYQDGTTVQGNVIADTKTVPTNTVPLGNGASRATIVSRINFVFSCSRASPVTSTNVLDRVFWDPEVQMDPSSVPVSASGLAASMIALFAILCVSMLL